MQNKEEVIRRINKIIEEINQNIDGSTLNYLRGGKIKKKRIAEPIQVLCSDGNIRYFEHEVEVPQKIGNGYRKYKAGSLEYPEIGGSLEYPEIGGKMRRKRKPRFNGGSLEYPEIGGSLEYPVIGGVMNRKKRNDKGKKRSSDWINLVKKVQRDNGISYKEALVLASKYKK